MSKAQGRKRTSQHHREAAIRTAARGGERERQEREQARKAAQKPVKTPGQKPGRPRPAAKKGNRRPGPGRRGVGRPDGPLARRRRIRTRLLLATLLAVNVAAWVIWPEWSARLAVLVLSVLLAPLAAALLLRRR